ncbi:GEVED domain-containing protein [uncultured Flavobacterium sp.]|uniref:GEVED domain-containing protein n=1 Tax=uncultured Flavobacterium sp. TaxID=165435 RepID=UPI0030C8C4C4
MENSSPKLAKTKVPNTHLGFIKKCFYFFIAFFTLTNQSFGQITQRGTATTATSTNTSITINKPTGVVAGDIMLVNIGSQANNGNLSNPSLAGWNIVQGEALQNNNRRWAAVLYKIATNSEPNSYVFSLDNDTDQTAGAIIAFSGVDNTSPFDTPSPSYNISNNTNLVTATGLSTTTANAAIIMLGVANNNPAWSAWSTTNMGSLTELYEVAQGNNFSAAAAWAIKSTIGATGNGTASLGNQQRNGAILVALKPSCHPLTYCNTSYPSGIRPITNVTFAGINNNSSNSQSSSSNVEHEIFCNTGNVDLGGIYNISVNGVSNGNTDYSVIAYFDWNHDGDFTDSNEFYNIGIINNNNGFGTPATSTILVPNTASLGLTTMRIVKRYNTYPVSSCNNGGYGQTEDYLINVTEATPCTTPTAQATALNLTPTLTTITGSFTAASPAPNNYLVVLSTNATPPSPTNGTTYTIGGNVGAGYTVIDTDSNTTFTATGLLSSTLYYVYVFSYNDVCTGGPAYLTTSPRSGSTTTLSASYCAPTSAAPQYVYIDDIRFMGTLNDVQNLNSGYSTGYQNWTSQPKAIQAQGEGINVYYNNESYTGTAHVKAWVDWNKNGSFEVGELVYDTGSITTSSATFGFVIPPATTPGDYRIRIRNNVYYNNFNGNNYIYDFNACENFNYTFWGYYDGEAEDYLFTVINSCSANIVSVTDGQNCGSGTVNLAATATAGTTGFNWYSSETGATLVASTASGSWTTPSLTTTTIYWVTALNGSCESLKRTKVTAEISPLPTVLFTPSAPVICGDNEILKLTAGGDVQPAILVDEKFEGGGLGVFKNVNNTPNGAPYDAITVWQNKTSPYIPTNTQVWSPAISSGLSGNRFVMSTSDVNPPGDVEQFLELTTAVDATDVTNLTLTFDMYYSNYGDQITVQANNGTGWTDVQTYTSSIGIGTRFEPQTIDFTAYNNTASLKIRINFLSNWGDGIAVDNIKLFGIKTLNTAFNYNTAVVDAFQDMACTIPYITGTPITQIFIKPTVTQLENASFNIPVTTTLSNGCVAYGSVTVTNNTKLFTPSAANSDWNTASNWKPAGVPTASNCIVVYEDLNITGPNNVERGLNLTIKPGKTLNIAPNNSLVITDFINVEPTGTFQLENSSSLIQINNVANTGNIIYKRNATVKKYDYVYWSSPVIDFNMNGIPASARYAWNPTAPNANGGQGNWYAASGNMATGTGYIFRVPNSTSTTSTPDNLTTTFNGVPFNGTKNITVSRGDDFTGNGTLGTPRTISDDNWNLIGNPYPSAIGVNEFLEANSAIEGFVYVWTHGNSPLSGNYQNPFYQNYAYNYNPNDYIQINKTGSTSGSGEYKIASGQGFFVLMNAGSVPGPASATVTFNNSMRSENFSNNMFYKNANTSNNLTQDNSRIWLDLNSSAGSSRILVGYIQGATNQKDRMFDAFTENKDDQNFYSIIDNANNEIFKIQGKALPFNDDDIVPLGVKIVANGNHSIAISEVDGLFLQNQDIYLKDELLNIYHDLKSAPYTFTATAGVHNDRFKLVYKSATVLSNQTFNENEIQIAKNNNIINIESGNETMDNVKVFDTRGRLIVDRTKINNNTISIDVNTVQDQVLILNITTTEGIKITRKIL